jgi:MoaA/NifB/PqqE/SkfB family radical SAM enzyme
MRWFAALAAFRSAGIAIAYFRTRNSLCCDSSARYSVNLPTVIEESLMHSSGAEFVAELFQRVLKVMEPATALTLSAGYLAAQERRRAKSAQYGLPLPQGMALSVTARCNLACTGCVAGPADPNRRELSSEELTALIDQARDLGVYLFYIVGGEPFLREDLLDQMARADQDAFFVVFSNGLLLDESKVAALARRNNVLLLLSIEGFRESTDRWRGAGTFDALMDRMALLAGHRAFFGYSATVTTLNYREVASERFMNAMKEAGCRVVFHSEYVAAGPEALPEFQLGADDRQEFRERLGVLQRTSGLAFLSENLATDYCLGGSEFLHINPYGDAEPCPAIHFSTHNVRQHGIVEIVGSRLMRKMRGAAREQSGTEEICVFRSGAHRRLCA